jgi:tRNA threonylcarbamoyladenosine biosynthesis protein TsaB
VITLALDASTYVGTVAVFEDSRLLSEGSAAMRGREHEALMPAVDRALRDAGVGTGDIARLVCGAGPGSFTSLRIAASIAKGLAVGRGVPLFGVSSLALIVAANGAGTSAGGRYVARLDALRGESYVAAFERRGDQLRQARALELVRDDEVPRWADGARVVGPGEPEPWNPHVRGLPWLGPGVFEQPVNLAAWEPVYGRLAEAQVKWEAEHGRALRP